MILAVKRESKRCRMYSTFVPSQRQCKQFGQPIFQGQCRWTTVSWERFSTAQVALFGIDSSDSDRARSHGGIHAQDPAFIDDLHVRAHQLLR
jgi:hypothetical protein